MAKHLARYVPRPGPRPTVFVPRVRPHMLKVVSNDAQFGIGDLGFSLNPKKVVQRHIKMIRKTVDRHKTIIKKTAALAKKTAKRHVALISKPIRDIAKMRTGSGPAKRITPGAPPAASTPTQWTDENGNIIPADQLYLYTDDAGTPLGPAPPGMYDGDSGSYPTYDYGSDPGTYDPWNGVFPDQGYGTDEYYYGAEVPQSYVDAEGRAIDPRLLMTLPAARIQELAAAGMLYPGSGPTAQALLDRERAMYGPRYYQPPISYDDIDFPDWEPAPERTVYGVEHTPTNYAALAPPWYGSISPEARYMSETEETAWSDRDAVYPGAETGADEWYANVGPSFEDDYYGADSLSGIYDVLIGDPIKFWVGKWNESKAKLTSALVSIGGSSETLRQIRQALDSTIDATSKSTTVTPAGLNAIERCRQKLVALESNQANLEGRARGAALQVKQTADANPDSGLGIFPIVAVGVVVATIVGIVGAVVIHTQNVNALAAELNAIMTGQISAADVAKIKGADPSGFGLPDLPGIGKAASGVALLAAVGIGAYLLLGRKR